MLSYLITIRFYSRLCAPIKCLNKSKISRQNCMYVGTMAKKKVERRPVNRLGSSLREAPSCKSFTCGYSSRVAPQRCSFRFTARSVNKSFPIHDAKVLLLSEMTKFLGKKNLPIRAKKFCQNGRYIIYTYMHQKRAPRI